MYVLAMVSSMYFSTLVHSGSVVVATNDVNRRLWRSKRSQNRRTTSRLYFDDDGGCQRTKRGCSYSFRVCVCVLGVSTMVERHRNLSRFEPTNATITYHHSGDTLIIFIIVVIVIVIVCVCLYVGFLWRPAEVSNIEILSVYDDPHQCSGDSLDHFFG